MNKEAFSLFSTKSLTTDDEKDFIVEGIASTPATDSDGDSINSLGASFRNMPMPFLLNHSHESPVGQVIEAIPTNKGIKVKIRIPYVKEAGKLKEQTDYALHAIKYNVISGLSIGFSAKKSDTKVNQKGGLDINKFEVYELSLTPLQSNTTAFITAFKSLKQDDTDQLEDTVEGNTNFDDSKEAEAADTPIEVVSVEDEVGDTTDPITQDENTIPIDVSQTEAEVEAASDIVKVRVSKAVKLINTKTKTIKVSLLP